MKIYKSYSDPGHGWLAVKRNELIDLGIIDQITAFSYQSKSGQTVYLEEDCDLSLFFKAYKDRYGAYPQTKNTYQEHSRIRSLPNFKKQGGTL